MNGSRRYQKKGTAKACKETAADCSGRLGVSETAVRRIFNPSEWHHCNFKYGSKARAYYYAWDREDIAEALEDARNGISSRVTDLGPAAFIKAWRLARKAYRRSQVKKEQPG